jgi:hypothetical protein
MRGAEATLIDDMDRQTLRDCAYRLKEGGPARPIDTSSKGNPPRLSTDQKAEPAQLAAKVGMLPSTPVPRVTLST